MFGDSFYEVSSLIGICSMQLTANVLVGGGKVVWIGRSFYMIFLITTLLFIYIFSNIFVKMTVKKEIAKRNNLQLLVLALLCCHHKLLYPDTFQMQHIYYLDQGSWEYSPLVLPH